jgi:hypothetical protein
MTVIGRQKQRNRRGNYDSEREESDQGNRDLLFHFVLGFSERGGSG